MLSRMKSSFKPRILITTATRMRLEGLRRLDAVGGVNYAEAVVQCGGLPLFTTNLAPELADDFVESVDGLLLSGGEDVSPHFFGQTPQQSLGIVDEARDLFELALYKAAKRKGVPVLGICRGIQLVNVAEGGTLHQHLPALPDTVQHGQRNIDGTLFHEVRLEPGSLLEQSYGATTIRTNSYHHQAIDALGDGLRATGWAQDGIVEAAEGTGRTFVLAVQWHPEMSFARYDEQIAPFRVFMDAVKGKVRGLEPVHV